MGRKRGKTFNVVVQVHTDTKPDRDRMRGILRFTLAHPEWNVLIMPGHPENRSVLDTQEWTPDDHGRFSQDIVGKAPFLR